MQTKQTVAPVYECFTLQEVKKALRVTHDLQDDLIWDLARSARKMCEDAARIAISPQTYATIYRAPERRGDEFWLLHNVRDPERILRRLVLPRPPTQAIVSVTLKGRETYVPDLLLLQDTHFTFDLTWGSITWNEVGWPFLTDPCYPTVEVVYVAGYPVILGDPLVDGSPPNPTPDPDRTVRQVDCDDVFREAVFVTTAMGYDDPDAAKSRLPDRAVALLRPYWNSPRMAG